MPDQKMRSILCKTETTPRKVKYLNDMRQIYEDDLKKKMPVRKGEKTY